MCKSTITLNENQTKTLQEFYRINNASGHCDTILDMFQAYLSVAGSHPENQHSIQNNFYFIRKTIKLIRELETAKPVTAEVKILKLNQN